VHRCNGSATLQYHWQASENIQSTNGSVAVKVKLHEPKTRAGEQLDAWASCEPFLHNENAVLIHRPRSVFRFRSPSVPNQNIIIDLWCGGTVYDRGQCWYMDYVEANRLLCERCELAAVRAGLLSASEIVGSHVHVGGVRAVQFCCRDKGASN
jgi:hypothetical protein